ncbi:tetratricopeptide repeat protein [Carboxylicivirga linearis]|uniref:histidine kinase n=1 Tax=Carboxylicivirga linearis TaxID=1628157 RepID=A0ABS5JR30_9BACT|nr:tetratricopeptide repeat protein [Carboxylicivirga linearis]MBS2097292.1 tetratricopeptide repeat-containing sensor histidine kinase [Carboxylicivirga linearis]
MDLVIPKTRIPQLFLFVLFLCVSTHITAQNDQANELLSRLKNASTKEQVDIYNQLSKTYLYNDPQMAIKYARQALQLALQLKDKRGEAEAYNNLGMGYYFVNDYEQLLASYRKSLSSYRDIGDDRSITMLSSTYFRLKQSEKALKSYKRSLNLYIKDKDWIKIAETYKKMADVYKNIADYRMALSYYKQALDLVEDGEGEDAQGDRVILLGEIAEIFFYQEQYDTALVYYHRMESILNELGDHRSKSILLSNIANAYFYKGDLDESFKSYQNVLKYQIENNEHWEAAMSLLNIGMIYSRRGDYNNAIKSHKKSLAVAQSIEKANDLIRDNYLALSQIYEELKDFKKAYQYRIMYSKLSESLMMEENVSNFVDVLGLQELEEKKKENEILQAKNKNYLLELEKENLVRWRLLFGSTILIISILVFVIYYRYYLKREENKNLEKRIAEALKKQEEQQQIIMHQSSLTSLGELAAGIAHEINQPMQNISLSTESIKYELAESTPNKGFINQSVEEIFEDIVRVRQIVDHIRIFSSGQKDEVEEEFNVSECVRNAVSMIGNQYANHHIKLRLDLIDSIPLVLGNPHRLEQVIHNLLSNARDAVEERRLAEEQLQMEVAIRTHTDQKQVYLEIADNGIGIPANRKTDIFLPFVTSKQLGKGTGLGLSISYSLIKEMNGRIEVESEHGEGTRMIVVLPVFKKRMD